jgi:hypothetical protein
MVRGAVAVVVLAAAPVWYQAQRRSIAHRAASLVEGPAIYKSYWMGWQSFFDEAAEAADPGRPFRLPHVALDARWTTEEVFVLSNPRGRDGVVPLPVASNHGSDCAAFWRKVQEVRKRSSAFGRVPLPASMAIVGFDEEPPPGDHLVCRTAAKEGQPAVLRAGE